MSIEEDVKASMEASLKHLKDELAALRTNRANPAILDGVMVEVYGTKMRLKDLASITVPEPRQLLITPYDTNNISMIAKGIENANLNLQPISEGNVIRINIPPMDETRRKEIAKRCKKEGEDAKISIREARKRGNDLARKQKASGEITEDIQRSVEKKIQEETDRCCKEADSICALKEKEILEI
jgi:ribosome recycling factor